MNPTIHDEAELWAAAATTGGLSAAELQAWNEHIQACPACQKLHQENLTMAELINKTLEADRESDSLSPDAGFEQRIISRLDRAGMGRGNRWYEHLLFHPGLTVAAACLVATLMAGTGWFLHRSAPSKFAATATVAGNATATANRRTPPARVAKASPGTAPRVQRSAIAVATTPQSVEGAKPAATDADHTPDGPALTATKNPPSPAPGGGLSIGEGTRIETFAPMNNGGQPTFSLTNPHTKYLLDPGTEQKIATIASAHEPALQAVSASAAKVANPAHHHKRHHPHHRRRRHRHHHPHPSTPIPAATVTLSSPSFERANPDTDKISNPQPTTRNQTNNPNT